MLKNLDKNQICIHKKPISVPQVSTKVMKKLKKRKIKQINFQKIYSRSKKYRRNKSKRRKTVKKMYQWKKSRSKVSRLNLNQFKKYR